jgi:4-amino-4-deoxy-L-arabinose transferase-like glycosyltransferase
MPENPKSKIQNPKSKIVWLIFAFLIVFVYFFGLTIPLLGPDEPRYSQIAREMFERGDWVTPKLGGFDWFEKPALLYWLQIASYKLFGVNEFAARFGSALFGLGTIFSLWILGKSVSDSKFQIPNSKTLTHKSGIWNLEFANWLAIIAASSIGLLAFSRGASFDIILTFPITAALVGFFVFDSNQSPKSKVQSPKSLNQFLPLFAFYFFIGVALLAKGLVGIVFPFAIVAFYYLLSWKFPSKTFIYSLIWGTILSLLVAAVWYLPVYQANGWKFVDEFFIQHHFQRYTSNKYLHPQPFWYFFLVLPLMTIPWLPFFLASNWNFFKSQIANRKSQIPDNLSTLDSRLSTFAFAWLAVPLVFFSLSGSKLPGYILPSLPGALVLTAIYVVNFAAKSAKRKRALQIVAFAVFAFAAIGLQFAAPKFAYQDSTKGLFEKAAAEGYADAKVLNLHTISHNAEFYAAGRLARGADGKLKKYFGVSEVAEEIRRQNGASVLVLVPLEYLHELPESDLVESKILGDNGELAIALVSEKKKV